MDLVSTSYKFNMVVKMPGKIITWNQIGCKQKEKVGGKVTLSKEYKMAVEQRLDELDTESLR